MAIYLGKCSELSSNWIHAQLNEICIRHGGNIFGPLYLEPNADAAANDKPISRWQEYDVESGRKLISDSFARDIVERNSRYFEDQIANDWTDRLINQFNGDFRIFCNWYSNPWIESSGFFGISDSTFSLGRILIDETKYIYILDNDED